MPENRFSCGIKDNIAIEANRILDSCKDRDCYENVRVFLTEAGNQIIERTNTVRVKDACIASTFIGLDPVQFNHGFFTVTIRFFVRLVFEGCVGVGHAQEFDGIAVIEKKVILYGGESNVSVFRSSPNNDGFCAMPEPCHCERSLPLATVEVVDPIVLDVKVLEHVHHCICPCCCCDIPETVCSYMSGVLTEGNGRRYLAVSLGIFSVVRLTRPAQYLIQATEYCVPDKECTMPCQDDPCGVFRSMAFPTKEFCPGTPASLNTHSNGGKSGCGC